MRRLALLLASILALLLRKLLPLCRIADVPNSSFQRFASSWRALEGELKQQVYKSDYRNSQSVDDFEFGWGAQSRQFVIDGIPALHDILLKNYSRKDELEFLDVGAGSAAGTELVTLLHSNRNIYSKLNVTAVDYIPLRERWVKLFYPKVKYIVQDVTQLPANTWDIVFCSHVIEHLEDPRQFCAELVRVCRGFALVYAPYNEINRIEHHLSTITESTFEGFNTISLDVKKSMAWFADKPSEKCILAVIDCRK